MKVEELSGGVYKLKFDAPEVLFLNNEAKDNDMSVAGIFEMLLGMLFIGGYSNIVGKDE